MDSIPVDEEKNFSCGICNKNFLSASYLNHHFILHLEKSIQACEICGQIFTQKDDLKCHLVTHGQKSKTCDICGEVFSQSDDLTMHVCAQRPEKVGYSMIGQGSTAGFSESVGFDDPRLCHDKEVNFSSEISDKKMANSLNLRFYRPTHTEQRQLCCSICGVTFDDEINFRKHNLTHLQEDYRQLKKDASDAYKFCSVEFSNAAALSDHLKSKSFPCNICGKHYTQSGSLKNHIRTHTKERPYICKICDKNFATNSSLKLHVRIHTKEKYFPCDICGKRYTQSGTLKIHIRSHTKEKPYVCKYCGKSFVTNTKLKIHLRIHTKEKPYPCEICGKCFSQSGSLKIHLRTHKNGKLHLCEICGLRCWDSCSLLQHLRTHGTQEVPHAFDLSNKIVTS